MAASKDLQILQGKTFSIVLRWEVPPIIYKPITGISQTAPVRITAVGHGLVEGWRAAVTNVKGMTEINADMLGSQVRDKDYHQSTVVDDDTVEFNDVNAGGYKAYSSGGFLQYNTPVDLTGMSARMDIKDKVGGNVLLALSSVGGDITVDNTKKLITVKITAAATAALTWRSGVYDLELVSADVEPVVTALLTGKVFVTKEVTT